VDERQVGEILLWHNGRWQTPNRARTLASLTRIYEENHVIVDEAPLALCRCCEAARDCWAGERLPAVAASMYERGETASIFWPWVGEEYRRGGVCLVSLNINAARPPKPDEPPHKHWTIGVEYTITEVAIDDLERGSYESLGSKFAYRSMATALAVLASLDGQDPVEKPRPQEAATAYERVARVQAIKCSTLHNHSRPTKAMRVNCPGRFARPELELLVPGVLVALGRDGEAAIGLLGEESWTESGEHFRRGRIAVGSSEVDVLALPHPTSHGRLWPTGQSELVASLRASPLSR
jgi:hypothetical protein